MIAAENNCERALAVLRDALDKAAALTNEPRYNNHEMGPWERRADQRTIYESAIEIAIDILGRETTEGWPVNEHRNS